MAPQRLARKCSQSDLAGYWLDEGQHMKSRELEGFKNMAVVLPAPRRPLRKFWTETATQRSLLFLLVECDFHIIILSARLSGAIAFDHVGSPALTSQAVSLYLVRKQYFTSQSFTMTGRGGGGSRKTLLAPIHFIFSLLQKRNTVSIWLYENLNTRVEGKIRACQSSKPQCPFADADSQGFDEFMNLVVDDAVEVQLATKNSSQTRRQLGMCIFGGSVNVD